MVKPRPRRPQIGYDNQIFPKPGEYDDLLRNEWDMEQEQQLQDWRSPNETGYPKIMERQAAFRRPLLPGFGNKTYKPRGIFDLMQMPRLLALKRRRGSV